MGIGSLQLPNISYIGSMERSISDDMLRLKLAESVATSVSGLTRRDIELPQVPGKVLAVIGVRRGGKTSLLRSLAHDAIAGGSPRESQMLLSLEDERLFGMTAADLAWLVDEHGRQFPDLLAPGKRTLYFDEIHLVDGWETYVRRLVDTGVGPIFVSGSSAKILSREVATSLRGRGLEVLVHPFSFRESLRHRGAEPDREWARQSGNDRIALDGALAAYLDGGGFPESQGVSTRDRLRLLRGYVDSMVLRDVIDRHGVTNPLALQWLRNALLSAPSGRFSVTKFRDTLRSQGVPVAKETLETYLGYLEDAFLLRVISMHSSSERQRTVNPRKAYPVDPGLIALHARVDRSYRGASLETVVLLELERRGYVITWVKTGSDVQQWEVDFLAEQPGEQRLLIQVTYEADAESTWERETRALEAAAATFPDARAMLITGTSTPPSCPLPAGLEWRSAAEWLLST